MSRYVITERAQAEAPADTDRGAGAVARASGVYDLRDTQADRVICSTASGHRGLKALRAQQARLNTAEVLG
jgi:hypothetical protein